MWRIMQHDVADDFVLATGRTTYIRDFVRMAFRELGVELDFHGEGEAEKGVVASVSDGNYRFQVGQEVVAVDPRYFRPAEVDLLIGDASKAKRVLGWEPRYTLEGMVQEMVASDLKSEKKNATQR
jgi:GDPmannose 4,6-dehydratase